MTKEGKVLFINEIISIVRITILSKVDYVPEEWDGIELRQLIADHFQATVFKSTLNKGRKRSYNKEVLVRNLI
jgi:hypothetical protein